ncbi:MAG: pyridoxal-phosphate dependent enzyme [Anaerolineaceae bacterium]|nr:pyridoxal-phosphate dependent enzyme [Anaerolineaceae bacterium]
MSELPTLADIIRAEHRIRPYLPPTPLEAAPELGENVFLKLENANKTHSFKVRGALNAVLSLDDDAREKGLVAASSGNHAQGLAYAASLVDAEATIMMPKHTPQKKVKGVLRYGAEAILCGDNYDETEAEALRWAENEDVPFVSPYNDPDIIAGAGTVGLEIAQQRPNIARVVVPLSGGGLLSGVALAIDALCPTAEIIGVNAESAPAFYNLRNGTNLPQNWDTLAEALSGDIEEGSITIPLIEKLVDDIVLVSEAQIAAAMRWMLSVQGWLVEGGGAVGVAAIMHNIIPNDGKETVIVVSGGSLDLSTLQRVLASSDD